MFKVGEEEAAKNRDSGRRRLQPDAIYLNTPAEFNFSECLVYLARSKDEPLHRVDQGRVQKLIIWQGQPVLFELSESSHEALQIRVLNAKPSAALLATLRSYVMEWFDLDRDLRPFYQMAQKDPLLSKLTRRFFGLRLIRIHCLFQALCWAIIGQQINLAFAYTLYRGFIESFGESYDFQGRRYWLFPDAERITQLSVADLRSLQFTEKKSEYLIGLAQKIKTGALSKQMLMTAPDLNAAKVLLLDLHGVGPWTANYVLMRCLGDPSAFPVEDIGLQRAVQLQLNRQHRPGLEEIQALAAGWAGWQAYATFYLYRSLYE